jgi:hypothetical protein
VDPVSTTPPEGVMPGPAGLAFLVFLLRTATNG